MYEGLTCCTEVTQPVGATYTCFASACAEGGTGVLALQWIVGPGWVNVQRWPQENSGGRDPHRSEE